MTPALAHFDTWQLIALAAAFGWASGLRLYAVLFIVGAVGYLQWFELPAGSHLATSGSRAVINTSPEPVSNWTASFGEELAVGTVLWLAFTHPIVALAVIAVLVALMIWLIPKVWRMIRTIAVRIAGWLGGDGRQQPH